MSCSVKQHGKFLSGIVASVMHRRPPELLDDQGVVDDVVQVA